jgi:hypothetical protein
MFCIFNQVFFLIKIVLLKVAYQITQFDLHFY